MLRTLVATGARRHRAVLAVTGATVSTGCFVLSSSALAPTNCSAINDNVSSSSSSPLTTASINNSSLMAQSPTNSASLVAPTLQATMRAVNLFGTVVLMVCDYEYAKFNKRLRPKITKALPESIQSALGPSNSDDEEAIRLEQEVEQRRNELKRAQAEYTGKGDENAANRQVKQTAFRGEVRQAAERLADAEEELAARGGDRAGRTHRKAAGRLLRLCRENGGVYIKVGQHLANLDYLIPQEYIETLSSLFDDAPITPYDDVREVIKEDLGSFPEELFDSFETEPIASASLAQVHVAKEKGTGRKLAIKVQHRGLRETSRGDIFALQTVVHGLEVLFPTEFNYGWIMEEIAPQLPRELNFVNEGRNSEVAASHIKKSGIDCVVPAVHWDATSQRVLTMDFEEGFRATNVQAIKDAGMSTHDVAKLISSVFNAQVFESGHVHCDPHPANVLLREKNGQPQLVLVDHGLYKQIDDDFRLHYARLWKALMTANVPEIKASCSSLGIKDMYPLLASMLTSRPFDEIVERSKTGALEARSSKTGDASDKAMIRGYAQKFIVDILEMLDSVPRQMLLLFKLNDCLRHIDHALGSPTNTLVTAGSFAAKAVYDAERRDVKSQSIATRLGHWLSYVKLILKIHAYEWVSYYRRKALH